MNALPYRTYTTHHSAGHFSWDTLTTIKHRRQVKDVSFICFGHSCGLRCSRFNLRLFICPTLASFVDISYLSTDALAFRMKRGAARLQHLPLPGGYPTRWFMPALNRTLLTIPAVWCVAFRYTTLRLFYVTTLLRLHAGVQPGLGTTDIR